MPASELLGCDEICPDGAQNMSALTFWDKFYCGVCHFFPEKFLARPTVQTRVVQERALTSSRHDISPQCLARKLALHSWRHDQLMMTLIILTLHNQSTVLCSA